MGHWGDLECPRCGNESVVPLSRFEDLFPRFKQYLPDFEGWPCAVSDDGTVYALRGSQGVLSPELGECIPLWDDADIRSVTEVAKARGDDAVCTHCCETHRLLKLTDQ